jgi:ribulose bisphosphate carboxylase small subunit
MNRNNEKSNTVEKNRIRDEIEAQIQAFLQQGGKIDVVATGQTRQRNAIGSVWHGQDDLTGLGQ